MRQPSGPCSTAKTGSAKASERLGVVGNPLASLSVSGTASGPPGDRRAEVRRGGDGERRDRVAVALGVVGAVGRPGHQRLARRSSLRRQAPGMIWPSGSARAVGSWRSVASERRLGRVEDLSASAGGRRHRARRARLRGGPLGADRVGPLQVDASGGGARAAANAMPQSCCRGSGRARRPGWLGDARWIGSFRSRCHLDSDTPPKSARCSAEKLPRLSGRTQSPKLRKRGRDQIALRAVIPTKRRAQADGTSRRESGDRHRVGARDRPGDGGAVRQRGRQGADQRPRRRRRRAGRGRDRRRDRRPRRRPDQGGRRRRARRRRPSTPSAASTSSSTTPATPGTASSTG